MAPATALANASPQTILPTDWTLADLQAYLGGVPLDRIRLYPPPGMATLQDALEIRDRDDRLCELVDGILVEKPMGTYESIVAVMLAHLIHDYLEDHPLGIVLGADGALWILPRKMRIPDLSFIRWDRFPNQELPNQRVYEVAPDLAVEVLSEGNTEAELDQKLNEYFEAGVQVVWYIDPASHSARAFTSPSEMVPVGEDGTLDGGEVLPGFCVVLRDLFERGKGTAGSEPGEVRDR